MNQKFKDKRKREWEVFSDSSYYDMICVRCLSIKKSKDFNSEMSFHFMEEEKAKEFIELLKISY